MMQTYLQENTQRSMWLLSYRKQTRHNIMFKFQTKFNIIYPSFLAKHSLIAGKPQVLLLFLSKSGVFPIALWDTASSYSFVM